MPVNPYIKESYIILTETPEKIYIRPLLEEGYDLIELYEQKIKKCKTKEEIKEVNIEAKKELGITLSKIICYGEVTNTPPPVFKAKCPRKDVVLYSDSLAQKRNASPSTSFKCFVGLNSDDKRFGLILHEDIVSSWKCAIDKLDSPKYAILYYGED